MKNEIIRVAIAGQGRSGYSIHADALRKKTDKYRIVAVADLLPERRRDARNEFGAKAYADWRPMLAAGGFDLFVNALPQTLHPPATIAAFEHGYHAVCEKPICKNIAQFDRITAAARKHRRVFAPFQNNRLQPFFDKIQEVIASGVLGKIVYIRSAWGKFARRWDWQTLQKNWGGSLFNTGPHAVDQALCLFGWGRMPKIFCRMDCHNAFGGDAEDHCTVTLYDPRRQAPQIDIIISSYLHYPQGDLYNINGTCGGLTGGATELKWRYFDPQKAPKHKFWAWSEKRRYPAEQLDWMEQTWRMDPVLANTQNTSGYTLVSFESGRNRFYDNVFDVVRNNGKLIITPAQVRRQIAVIGECHRQNPLPRLG